MADLKPAPAPEPAKIEQPEAYSGQPEPKLPSPVAPSRDNTASPFWLGLTVSLAWVVIVAAALISSGESSTFGGIPLTNWAIGLCAIASPIALIWMITAYLQRAYDVQLMTEPLRRQLNLIIGENGAAENRIRRFNAAIREQIELLRQGSVAGEEEIVNLLQQLAWEREEVKKVAMHRMAQLQEAGKLTQAAEAFDGMLDSKLKLISDIESRLQRGNGQMVKNAEQLREALTQVLQDIKEGNQNLEQSLASVRADSVEIRSSLRGQEEDLINTQMTIREAMAKAEKEFDVILDRFYDRSKDVANAFEQSTAVFAARLQDMDAAGRHLPARIAAATDQLNTAIANYQTIEHTALQAARATAAVLDTHVQDIAGKVEGFGQKIQNSSRHIDGQSQALAGLLDRITLAADTVQSGLQQGTAKLSDTAESSIARFTAVTSHIKTEAEALTVQLIAATTGYEAAAATASTAADRQQHKMAKLREQLSQDMQQLQIYEDQAAGSAATLQNRTDVTIGDLQDIEERLHTLTKVLAHTGEATHRQLQHEMQRHEEMLRQLSNATETGVVTLQRASQGLSAQQDGLVSRASQAEAQLQGLIANLNHLHESGNQQYDALLKTMNGNLRETATMLQAAELQFQDFNQRSLEPVSKAATHIVAATAQARDSLKDFSSQLERQSEQVSKYDEHVNLASKALEQAGEKSSGIITTLISNLFNLGRQQEETSQKTAQRFEQSSRAYRETLDGIANKSTHISGVLDKQLADLAARGDDYITRTDAAEKALQTRSQEIGRLHEEQATHYARHLEKLNSKLDQTASVIAETEAQLTEFSEDTLKEVNRAANRINDSVAQGSAAIVSFSDALDNGAAKYTLFQSQLLKADEQFKTSASSGSTLIGDLLERILGLGKKQEELLRQTENGIVGASQTLNTTLDQIGVRSAQTAAQLDGAAATIGLRSQELIANTATAEQQLQQRADQIQLLHHEQNLRYAQQSLHLQQSLEIGHDALTATEAKLVQFGAETLAPMLQASTQIRQAVGEGSQSLTQFTQTLDQQTGKIRAFRDDAQQAYTALEQGTARSNTFIGTLLSNLLNLGQKQDDLAQKIESRMASADTTLRSTLQGLDDRTDQSALALEQASARLAAGSRVVAAESGAALEQMQQQIYDLSYTHQEAVKAMSGHLEQVNHGVRETATTLAMTQEYLKDFATQSLSPIQQATDNLTASAERGGQSIDRLAQTLAERSAEVEQLRASIMQSRDAADIVAARNSEALNGLFGKIKDLNDQQDHLAQNVERSFIRAADRLSGDMEILSDRASGAAEKIEQAQQRLSTQSLAFIDLSNHAAGDLRGAADMLETRGDTLQTQLQDKLSHVAADLAQLEQRFAATGDLVQKKADSAYILLDQAGLRFHTLAQEMDKLLTGKEVSLQDFVAAQALQIGQLGDLLQDKLRQIGSGNEDLKAMADQITVANDRIISQLSRLHSEGAQASRVMQDNATAGIAQMSAFNSAVMQQQESLRGVTDRVIDDMTRISGNMEMQVSRLENVNSANDTQMRLLSDSLAGLEGKSQTLREAMGQHANALLAQLQGGVNQLQHMSGQLVQSVAQAVQGADQVQTKFDALNVSGAQQLNERLLQLQSLTQLTDDTMGKLRVGTQQQMEVLQDTVQHIAQQHGTLRQATTAQREELLELFDRLAQAHRSSALAAEESIAALTSVAAEVKGALNAMSSGAAETLRDMQIAGSGLESQSQSVVRQGQEAAYQVQQIMEVSENLAEHARMVTSQTQAEAGRLAADIAQVFDAMTDQGARLRGQTELIMREINTGSEGMTAQVADAVANLQLCGTQVRDTLAQQSAALRSQTADETERMMASVQQLLDGVDNSGGVIRARTQDVVSSISQSGDQIMQQIGSLLGSIASNNIQIREQMADHAAAVRSQATQEAHDMASAYRQVLQNMEVSGDELRRQADSVLNRIGNSREAMEAELTACLEQFNDGSSALREQALHQVAVLRDRAMQEARGMGDLFNGLVERINAASDGVMNQAGRTHQQISTLNGQLDDQFNQAMQRVDLGTGALRDRIGDQVAVLRDKALEEISFYGDKLYSMLTQIESGGNDMQRQTQEILAIIGTSRQAIADQFTVLLQQIDEKNQSALQRIAGQSQVLQRKADDETERFSASLSQLLGQIDGSIGHLRFQNEDVLSRISQAGALTKREFAQMLAQIAENQDKVKDEIADYTNALRRQAEADMARIAEDITVMLERIDGSGERLRRQVGEAVGTIDLGGDALAQQVETLLQRISGNHAQIRAQMMEHANEMRNQYALETAHTADNLRDIMAQMKDIGVEMRGQNHDILSNLDQYAVRFGQVARQAAQSVYAEVGKLDVAADQVSERLRALGSQLQDEQEALGAASRRVSAHTVDMAAQTASAANDLRGILDVLAESSTRTQGLSSHIAGQLQGMIIHLREEMQRLSEHSTFTANAATQVVAQVNSSVDSLLAAGAQVRQESTRLPQVIDIAQERVTRAGSHLREQAEKASEQMALAAQQVVSAGDAHYGRLASQTQNLQSVAEQADQTLRSFGLQLAGHLSSLQSGSGILVTEQHKLVDQAAAALAHMASACDRLSQLRDGAENANAQFISKLQFMDGQLQSTTKVLTVGTQSLGGSISQLAEISQKAEQSMIGAGANYRNHVQELRTGLQEELAGLHESVAAAALQLEQKAGVMRHVSDTALKDIAAMQDRFGAAMSASGEVAERKTNALRALAEDAAQLLLGFGKTVDTQLQHLSGATTTISNAQHYLTNTLDHSIQQVDILQQKMEGSRQLAQDSTEQVAAQLQKLSASLQKHIISLGQDTQQAVGMVDKAGQSWQEQAQNLARIAQQARSELAAISFAIDALQQKGDSMRHGIKSQGSDILSSLNAVIDQMEASGGIMTGDDALVDRIERGLKKIN